MADYYPLAIAPSDYRTISGVCRQYNAIIRNPARDAGGDVPGYEGQYMVWTPTEGDDNNTVWGNFKSDDGMWIVERKSPDEANTVFVDQAAVESGKRRIVYWRERKNAPFHFIGVYTIHPELTKLCGVRVYRQISDILPALEIIR